MRTIRYEFETCADYNGKEYSFLWRISSTSHGDDIQVEDLIDIVNADGETVPESFFSREFIGLQEQVAAELAYDEASRKDDGDSYEYA